MAKVGLQDLKPNDPSELGDPTLRPTEVVL